MAINTTISNRKGNILGLVTSCYTCYVSDRQTVGHSKERLRPIGQGFFTSFLGGGSWTSVSSDRSEVDRTSDGVKKHPQSVIFVCLTGHGAVFRFSL